MTRHLAYGTITLYLDGRRIQERIVRYALLSRRIVWNRARYPFGTL